MWSIKYFVHIHTHFVLVALDITKHSCSFWVFSLPKYRFHFSDFYSTTLLLQFSDVNQKPQHQRPINLLRNTWQIYTDFVNIGNYLQDMHILVMNLENRCSFFPVLDSNWWFANGINTYSIAKLMYTTQLQVNQFWDRMWYKKSIE